MTETKLSITPQTKVGELLDAYPELEELLVSMAPAFKKLRHPVLRRTVAKVTSLSQAAQVGSLSVIELVSKLREAAGLPQLETENVKASDDKCQHESEPDWFDKTKISDQLDARPMIDSGEEPIGKVFSMLDKLPTGKILEVVTPFQPAPLIDRAIAKGYDVWTITAAPSEHHTYFTRKQSDTTVDSPAKSKDATPPCQSTSKRFDV